MAKQSARLEEIRKELCDDQAHGHEAELLSIALSLAAELDAVVEPVIENKGA